MTRPAENWEALTPDERLEIRLRLWQEPPGLMFADAATAAAYRERVGIIRDALALRRPARVPICPMFGVYPLAYSGVTVHEAMYDYDRFDEAWRRFHTDFLVDIVADPLPSGRVFESIGYSQYRWPGHGTGDRTGYQYVEDEYMQAGEYEWLTGDPTGFLLGGYLPRIAGAFAPLAGLAPLLDLMEGPGVAVCLSQFGTPEMQGALRALLSAGAESMAWLEAVGRTFSSLASQLGKPAFTGGMTKAPFDVIGDTFRGTRGIVRDMFRRPEQLRAALERLVPLCVEQGVAGGDAERLPADLHPAPQGRRRVPLGRGLQHLLLADAQGSGARPDPGGSGPPAVRGGRLQPSPAGHRRPGDPRGQDHLAVRRHRHGGGAAGPRRARLHRRQRAGHAARPGHARRSRGLRRAPHRRRRGRTEASSSAPARPSTRRSPGTSPPSAPPGSSTARRSPLAEGPRTGLLAFRAKVVHSTPFFQLREKLLLV